MCEDVADVDHLPAVPDDCDEAVFVASHIEDRENAHGVCVPEVLAYFRNSLPFGALRHSVPMHQGLQGILVLFCEVGDGRFADDPHTLQVTKTVTWRARS